MSDEGFFEGVFEHPEDDPLLHSDDSSPLSDEHDPVPSWVEESGGSTEEESSDESHAVEESPDASTRGENIERKSVLVDPETGAVQGLASLNEAVQNGWQIIDLDYSRDGPSRDDVVTFVLQRENPQSLFEFS
jgi:hypothetical protein